MLNKNCPGNESLTIALIHTKTDFRPIKLQESRSGPYTNRMPYNNLDY